MGILASGGMMPITFSRVTQPEDIERGRKLIADWDQLKVTAAEQEAEIARNPDSDYAVFRQNGQVYATVTRQGSVIVNDHSFDMDGFRRRMTANMTNDDAVKILQSMLGKEYRLSYADGRSETAKTASTATARTSLQRQMELLAINRKA